MAYPTSPSQVGLTVAKSTLTLDATSTYSTTQTVTGRRFRQTVTVTGGTVTFEDCWFYGAGLWSVRANGGNIILRNCEIGIGSDDVTDEDPDGWQFDDHFVEISLIASSGRWEAYDSYIHHGGDLARIGSDCVLDHCYLGDLTTDTDDHADAVQTLGASGFVIRNNYISALSSAQLALASATAILLKSDAGDISGTVDGNFIDAEAFWAMQVRDGVGGAFPSGVVFTNNRFGRTASSGPFTTGSDGTLTTRYGNRFADDLSLIPGDSEPPSEGGSVGEYVQSKLEPVDSGATSTTVTFDSAPASGSLILLLFGSRSSSQIGNFVAPSGSTQLGADQWSSGSAVTAAAWIVESTGSSAYTVSHDAPAGFGGEGGLIAIEISNPDSIAADDFDWEIVSGGESTTVAFPTSTPTASPWVAVAFAASRESFQGLASWTNSFTEVVDYALGNGSGGVYAAYLNGTGTSNVTTTATATSAERHIKLMAVFTVSSGATTLDASASLTGTGSVAGAAAREANATASLSGSASIAASAAREANASASLSGSASVAASAVREANATASLVGAGSLAASALREANASAALVGVGSMSAIAVRDAFASTSLVGVGVLSATVALELPTFRRLEAAAVIGSRLESSPVY